MVILTDSAVQAVTRFIQNSEKNIAGLRIKVDGGGCSGFQYGLRLEDSIAEDDTVQEVNGINLVIDKASEPLLAGVTVDFIDGMEGSGFKFENPNATASCGCGKSFSA
ncbi:iron-sulfur cluster assembly accessory protein [Halioxenophilus sp. WMMB6]|uniref:HesB/IscA family protein n=1 Tax=Halioxenophilus sp. WMMB6 TaxID=3073815 RepID=UPI00295F017A|nr:iron-sulfur cluster assembly accessory protein [Halioxenophilus sp. WMMB6]